MGLSRKEIQDRYNKRKRAFIDKFKEVPCADCGIQYPPYVMDFDHLPEYEKEIQIGKHVHYSVERLLAEIEKCDVVCSNCHRIRTYNRMKGN